VFVKLRKQQPFSWKWKRTAEKYFANIDDVSYHSDLKSTIAGMGFFLCHHIQTGSEAHKASYPMGTGGSYPGGKVAGV
jgi:hypothetical protein